MDEAHAIGFREGYKHGYRAGYGAAAELEEAHVMLDEFGVPRVRAESGNAMTLAARVYTLGSGQPPQEAAK